MVVVHILRTQKLWTTRLTTQISSIRDRPKRSYYNEPNRKLKATALAFFFPTGSKRPNDTKQTPHLAPPFFLPASTYLPTLHSSPPPNHSTKKHTASSTSCISPFTYRAIVRPHPNLKQATPAPASTSASPHRARTEFSDPDPTPHRQTSPRMRVAPRHKASHRRHYVVLRRGCVACDKTDVR